MKKTLAIVLAVLMLVSVCAFGASAEAGKKKESVFEAPYGTPTIDGTIDAVWNTVTPQSFDQTVVQWDYDGGNHYKAAQMTDAIASGAIKDKAKFRALWDENYIYFLVEVKDVTMNSQCPATGNWHRQDAVGYSIGKDWSNASAGNTERSYCHLWAWDGVSANHTADNTAVWVEQSATEKNFKVTHTTGGYFIESKVKISASKNGINSLELKAGTEIPFDLWVNENLNTDGSPARQFIYTWADPTATTSNNNQAKGTLKLLAKPASDSCFLKENLAGKTDLIAGLQGTYLAKKYPDGLKTGLLTDGIIAVNKTLDGDAKELYFNKAYGGSDDAPALEFAGVDTKALYAFSYEGLGGAKVDSFQVVYGAQNDNKTGRSYNMEHADVQIMLLVSSDNGKTWTKAYISKVVDGSNVIKSQETTGGTLTNVDEADFCYHTVDIKLDKTYENVTNVVLASPVGRSQVNGWAARIMEFNVFGEKGANPVTPPAPVTGDSTVIFALFAVVAVIGSAYAVVRKIRG